MSVEDLLLHRVAFGTSEGIVVAATTTPTLTVRLRNGEQVHVVANLVQDLGKVDEAAIPPARVNPTNRLEDHLGEIEQAIERAKILCVGDDTITTLLAAKSHTLLAIQMAKGTLPT